MARVRSYFASVEVTPAAKVLLGAFVAGIVLFLVGSSGLSGAGLALAAVTGLFLLGGLSGGRSGRSTKSLADRRAEFHPIDRSGEGAGEAQPDAHAEEELWAAERERYRRS